MDKYIEQDLKNNPHFFREPHSGKFVDLSVVMHVVCDVNRPGRSGWSVRFFYGGCCGGG